MIPNARVRKKPWKRLAREKSLTERIAQGPMVGRKRSLLRDKDDSNQQLYDPKRTKTVVLRSELYEMEVSDLAETAEVAREQPRRSQ